MRELRITAFFYTIAFALVGCASITQELSHDNQLVGLWEASSPYNNTIILRKGDGTFLQKSVRIYNISKPAAIIEGSGKWKLERGNLNLEFTSMSSDSEDYPIRLGKPILFEIQKIESSNVFYLSTDGALVQEKKIGEASEKGFYRTSVSLNSQ